MSTMVPRGKIKFEVTFNSPADQRLSPTKIKKIIKSAFAASGYTCTALDVEKSHDNYVDEKEIALRAAIQKEILDALQGTNIAKCVCKDNGNIAKYKYVGLGFGKARLTDDSAIDYSAGYYRVLRIGFQPPRY